MHGVYGKHAEIQLAVGHAALQLVGFDLSHVQLHIGKMLLEMLQNAGQQVAAVKGGHAQAKHLVRLVLQMGHGIEQHLALQQQLSPAGYDHLAGGGGRHGTTDAVKKRLA